MKMHSYAFYNGHLSNTEHRLFALDNPETASTAAAVRYPSSGTQLNELDFAAEKKKNDDKNDSLTQLREDLALELVSPLGRVTYPQNLTMGNYADYILCPTLCYELEYPRTEKTQWMELLWKTLAVFGCIFLLTIISEEFIVPVLNEAALRLQGISSWSEMGLILAESISLLLFPFMITFLLVFLVIFEYLLGAFAEITCFADRHFYSDWWKLVRLVRMLHHIAPAWMLTLNAGSSSPENGTSQYTISYAAMSTAHQGRTCPAICRL